MRVLHVPFTYFPDPVGGTEVYVAQLAAALSTQGVESCVAAPGSVAAEYEHEGVPVRRYVIAPPRDLAELYNAAPAEGMAGEAGRLLDDLRPDVLNMHAYTRGVPLELPQAAGTRGIPVVVTYHTPSVTCQRGTLVLFGRAPCDGALLADRCAACVLRLHGTPGPVADLLAHIPRAVGAAVGMIAPRKGGVAAALRMTKMMADRHARVESHLRGARMVVAVSDWVADVLRRVGVPREAIAVVPHGILPPARPPARRAPDGVARLAFIGRMNRSKGIDLAIQALAGLRRSDIALDIFTLREAGEEFAYEEEIARAAARDPRITMRPTIPAGQVIETLAGYDALVVPSRCRETGPLVVLEAFAAGTPVIAAAIGAIPERVRDGHDGLLFPAGDATALAVAMERFAGDAALRARLLSGVEAPRWMAEVAREMIAIYRRALGSSERNLLQSGAGR